jgi:fibronectin-binding autotransporter adhesin
MTNRKRTLNLGTNLGSACVLTLLSSTLLSIPAQAANVWDGGGSNDNWNTPLNWDNDAVPSFPAALTFSGTSRLTPSNDLSGVTVNGITFASDAEAFTLNGNAITLGGNIDEQSLTADQIINLPITLGTSPLLTAAPVPGHYLDNKGVLVVNSVISGPYGLTAGIAGIQNNYVQLNGINTYSGDTLITGRDASFSIGNANAFGSGKLIVGAYPGESQMWIQSCGNQTITNDVEIRTGRFISVGYTLAGRTAGSLTLSGNVLLNQTPGKDFWCQRPLTLSGTVSGGNMNGLRMATGTLILQGNNTFTNNLLSNYTGSIPTFNINSDAAMGHTNNGVRAYNNSLIFQTAAGTSISLAPSRFFRSDTGKTLTFDIPENSTLTVPGLVYGNAFAKKGSGSLVLTGVNTYTGDTTLNGGILNISTNAALGDDSSALNFTGAGTLQPSVTPLTLPASRSVNLSNAGTYTAAFDVPTNFTMTVASALKGNVATNSFLSKTGPGTLILTGGSDGAPLGGLNMLAGKLSIQSGVWAIAPQAKNDSTVFNVLGGATYEQTGGTNTIPFYSCISQQYTGGTYTNLTSIGILSGGTMIGYELMVGRRNSAVMTISGNSLLDLTTFKLGEREGFTTICNLDGGVIACNYIASRCDDPTLATSILNLNGGTIRAKGNYNIIGASGTFTTSFLTTVNVKSGGAIIDSQSHAITIPQVLEHDPDLGAALDGGLVKRGAGSLTLGTNNTFNGVTSVEAGTLKLDVDNTLLTGNSVLVSSNALFNVNGKSQTLASLGGRGTVANNSLLTVTQEIIPGGSNTVGTLTLAATPAGLSGTFLADFAADGSCDRLHVQDDLDLSALTFSVSASSVLNKNESYVIASYTDTLIGSFSQTQLPKRWVVKYDTTNRQVYLNFNFGTLIMLR